MRHRDPRAAGQGWPGIAGPARPTGTAPTSRLPIRREETQLSGRVQGKVALITGAARGQGRAHAVTLAREGASIVAVDICEPIEGVQYDLATPADLDETARLVEEQDRRCVAIKADARSSEQMRAAADRAASEFGGIDIGVVNHGIVMAATWDALTDEDWDTMIETNLSSVWR